MRTLVAAAEPPERPRVDLPAVSSTGNMVSTATAVLTMAGQLGYTLTPWQAVVIRSVYRDRV